MISIPRSTFAIGLPFQPCLALWALSRRDPLVHTIGENLWQLDGTDSLQIAKDKVRSDLGEKARTELERSWHDVTCTAGGSEYA